MRARRIGRMAGLLLVIVVALLGLFLVWAAVTYNAEYVSRVLRWRESDVGDYLNNFPSRLLTAAPEPYHFGQRPDEEAAVAARFESIFGVDDLDAFLEETDTTAFLVIQGDEVLFERYYNGAERDSLMTSFSVAKSFVSTLIGMAIDEGAIHSVDDPITLYLPELAERDPRFEAITIRHLLMMASGLDYQESRPLLFNGDDPLTTYYPDQRQLALQNTQIVDPPGLYFQYNKYHPQLLGMILERATGMPVTAFMQQRLWDPVGMEFDGSWSLDSEGSGFEKMEAGLNARAIDFAKLGRLFLNRGSWNGRQVIPESWVAEATGLDSTTHNEAYYQNEFGRHIYNDGQGYYQYMWYGFLRDDGHPDFSAEGDHGQVIYASPQSDMVIVRMGTEYGVPMSDWLDAFAAFTGQE